MKNENVEIIFHQKNDSPKYLKLKKSSLYWFAIVFPSVTLISITISGVLLINYSPFHLIDNYIKNSKARDAISNYKMVEERATKAEIENLQLKNQINELRQKLNQTEKDLELSKPNVPAKNIQLAQTNNPPSHKETAIENNTAISNAANSIALSTLSFFKPVQGQKDRTRPAMLSVSGISTSLSRDTFNFQFNIIPKNEEKISGHIVVIMKNDLGIQVYPFDALKGGQSQINYSSGESFATQRFRPVNASFLKPKKSGNYTFSIFIFAKNGDLLHYQTAVMPIKI